MNREPSSPREIDRHSSLEALLRDDAHRLNPPEDGPSAGQIWWKSQILRRLAGQETETHLMASRRTGFWLFVVCAALFLISVSTGILLLIPEAEGPALVIYGLLAFLPLGVACGFALALGDP